MISGNKVSPRFLQVPQGRGSFRCEGTAGSVPSTIGLGTASLMRIVTMALCQVILSGNLRSMPC